MLGNISKATYINTSYLLIPPINPISIMRALGLLFTFICLCLLSTSASAQSFGGSLALSEAHLFVGETGNAGYPGEVYVFNMSDKEKHEVLSLENGFRGDRFGSSLAYDGEHLLVGARSVNDGAGAVYLYSEKEGMWHESGALAVSSLGEEDGFGSKLVQKGDLLAVAATGHKEEAGGVYLFKKSAEGDWEQAALLTAGDAMPGDAFGSTLALSENLLAVSSPSHDSSRGAVYVYAYNAEEDSWQEKTKLSSDEMGPRSGYGSAMIFHGSTLYVSAPNHDQRQGVVLSYEYDEVTGQWDEMQTMKAFDSSRFLQFGRALAVNGGDLWVGAPGYSRMRGAIYVYSADEEEGWSGVTKIKGGDPGARAAFGSSIVVENDMAAIGATGLDSRSGAAMIYAYNSDDKSWEKQNKLINEMKSYPQITGAEVRCEDNKAGEFECDNVDILSFLPLKEIGAKRGVRLNDMWGWKDQETGKEYALIGRSNGTSFVDVTDPFMPKYIGDLPMTEGSRANVWRDIKVYDNHAFIVADGAGPHGMQVFDLKQLGKVTDPPANFTASAHYDNIASAHNIVINESTGYAYIVGSSGGGETCGGGLHMVNIQKPLEPSFVGCFADTETGRRGTGYSHDAQCVIYTGPDDAHQGKEVCFGSNETALSIADVSDKNNPVALSTISYPKVAYSHQGWLTEDQRYFYMNDEIDEVSGLVPNTRTLIWDVSDLEDPILVKEHLAETTAMDHNLYIKGDLMYQSNYDAGFRILDISDPVNPVEVGYFDTTPFDGTGGGSWSNYPYFESGAIIVNSSYEGMFILKKSDVVF